MHDCDAASERAARADPFADAVVLHDDAIEQWLSPGNRAADEMLELLVPQQPVAWQAYAVSPRVGNVRNDDASLIEPADDNVAISAL